MNGNDLYNKMKHKFCNLYLSLKKWHIRFKSDIIQLPHSWQSFVSFKSEQLSNILPTLMVHYNKIQNKGSPIKLK